MFAASQRFFALPIEHKQRVSIKNALSNYGYVAIGDEKLDPARPGDAKEAFNIGRDLAADDPDILAGKPFHAVNQWPDLPGFRPVLVGYFVAMQRLSEQLHRAFAIDLGLPEDFFRPYIDAPLATLRVLHYPPHPVAFDGQLYGAAPHTDYGNLTILAQDDAGGLQVRQRDGQLDRRAAASRNVRMQHRRLSDAMEQRCLRVNAASRREPFGTRPLLGRFLL